MQKSNIAEAAILKSVIRG